MTAARKEFDFGVWDSGSFRFKSRQISPMPNGEIVFDMEQYKHGLEQIEVSKADKTKPDRILNSKEHTQVRGGVWESGLACRSLLSTVIISTCRIAPKTINSDSSRFVEAQQGDSHCKGD